MRDEYKNGQYNDSVALATKFSSPFHFFGHIVLARNYYDVTAATFRHFVDNALWGEPCEVPTERLGPSEIAPRLPLEKRKKNEKKEHGTQVKTQAEQADDFVGDEGESDADSDEEDDSSETEDNDAQFMADLLSSPYSKRLMRAMGMGEENAPSGEEEEGEEEEAEE